MGNLNFKGIHWAIIGGESGHVAREFDIRWARSIIRQCREQGVPCFVKQIGTRPVCDGKSVASTDFKGGNPDEWPLDLRVREFPERAEQQLQNHHSAAEHPIGSPKSVHSLQDPAFAGQRHDAALKAWVTRRAKDQSGPENTNIQIKKGEK
jgi:hypothetical protein